VSERVIRVGDKGAAKGEKKGLLTEIRVLDLSDEKGSFCSKLLADMGAYVIKVEKPGGNSSRMIGPFWGDSPHPERSLSFFYNNTNKFGITLNLECDAGRKLFAQLISKTDVVVESFTPGYLDTLGLGFDFLSEMNPRLIMASITGFGQTGPRKDFKSCDLVASAFGGQISISGSPSLPPIKPFGEQSYLAASLFAAVGILLALQGRARNGKGEHIDISLQEAAISTLDHVMIRYFHEHVITKRQGNRYWNTFFSILPCKNGFIHLTPFQHWETLVEWLDSGLEISEMKNGGMKAIVLNMPITLSRFSRNGR
jgi:crotonobetainyl-CoA:carnitine CoA-transferase CaiB-like acyl-CoA transferase